MGLGSSRGSRSSAQSIASPSSSKPQIKKEWTEEQIARLIEEKKLASRKTLGSLTVDRETECPICFNDFEQLNSVSCCNQFICTDCYVKIRKPGQINCLCPFCDNAGFPVMPVDREKVPSLEHGAPQSPDGTPGSNPQAFRRKTPTTPVHIPLATKADRESIEKDIQISRSMDTGDDLGRLSAGRSSYSSANSGMASLASQLASRRAGSRDSGTPVSPEDEMIRGLSRMLQGSNIADVNDIMLLAAIRQSMQQGQPPAPPTQASAADGGGSGQSSSPSVALSESAIHHTESGGEGQPPGPAPATPVRTQLLAPSLRDRAESGISEMSELSALTEDEQLQLAISLSLSPSSGSP